MDTKKKIDWTKPIQTTGGLPAGVYHVNSRGNYPVQGWISDGESGDRAFACWRLDGRGMMTNVDVVNVPERIHKEVWIITYQDGSISAVRGSAPTADDLKYGGIRPTSVTKHVIDCEEGDGLG